MCTAAAAWLICVVFAASTIARWFSFVTFPCWSKSAWSNPAYVMDSLMEMEDWALGCSWPPVGDQWQYSVDQFFEPLQLLDGKSDEPEYQPISNDVTVQQNHSFNAVWSAGSSCTCVWLIYTLAQLHWFAQFAESVKFWDYCWCFFFGLSTHISWFVSVLHSK